MHSVRVIYAEKFFRDSSGAVRREGAMKEAPADRSKLVREVYKTPEIIIERTGRPFPAAIAVLTGRLRAARSL